MHLSLFSCSLQVTSSDIGPKCGWVFNQWHRALVKLRLVTSLLDLTEIESSIDGVLIILIYSFWSFVYGSVQFSAWPWDIYSKVVQMVLNLPHFDCCAPLVLLVASASSPIFCQRPKSVESFSSPFILPVAVAEQSVSAHYPSIPFTYLCSITITAREPTASLFTTSIQRGLQKSFKCVILQIYLRTFYYFSPSLR